MDMVKQAIVIHFRTKREQPSCWTGGKKDISQHKLANTGCHKARHIIDDLILMIQILSYHPKERTFQWSLAITLWYNKTDTLHSRGEQLLFTSHEFTICMHTLHCVVYMSTNEWLEKKIWRLLGHNPFFLWLFLEMTHPKQISQLQ